MDVNKHFALISVAVLVINGQHNPNFKYPRRGIVELFEWKYVDIAHECETFLGIHNFGGVQVSPVNENIIIKNRPWWERYQPMSFKILTRSGNSHEFLDMTKRCNDAGIRVYVDIVINHMAAPQSQMIGTAGSTASYKNYPSAGYSCEDFHWSCKIESYIDAHQVRNCELENMPDLNHASPYVRGKIVSFMNYLIDLGVAGFRISACKHMWPNDLKEIYNSLKNLREGFDFESGARPFIIQEVLDFGGEPISKLSVFIELCLESDLKNCMEASNRFVVKFLNGSDMCLNISEGVSISLRTEYTSFGVVTEFIYARDISNIIRGQSNLSELIKLGPELGYLHSNDALVFTDNQDTQRGFSIKENRSLNYKLPKKYIMANCFMLAYPYGTIRIMSSYEFSYDNIDEGPPIDKDEKILSVTSDENGNCQNGWICEHRWPAIVEMVKFRVNVFETAITKWRIFEDNTVGFCREDKGFIVFSNTNFDCLIDKVVFVCVPPGQYCDVIKGYDQNGNCLNVIKVDSKRNAVLIHNKEETDGVIAFHIGSRIKKIA